MDKARQVLENLRLTPDNRILIGSKRARLGFGKRAVQANNPDVLRFHYLQGNRLMSKKWLDWRREPIHHHGDQTTMSEQAHFGDELRRWRTKRGRAQLDLANLAGYSQRHISFLESGRSQPSRNTVVTLAEALEVPLKDRNTLLQAAGFAPMFSAEPLNSEFLQFAIQALETVLESHRPFPAIVVDRAWNMYAGNDNAFGLFQMLLDQPIIANEQSPVNVLRLCLSHQGFRPYLQNWPDFAQNMLNHLKRELDFDRSNESLQTLIKEFEADPEIAARTNSKEPPRLSPVSTLEFERDGRSLQLFTMISQISNPNDATLAELRVETFLPANEATRSVLNAIDANILAERTMGKTNDKQGSNIHWIRAGTVE